MNAYIRFLQPQAPNLRKIAELREIMGIDHFNANFWFGDMSQQQVLGSMQLFTDEVLPVMKSDAI